MILCYERRKIMVDMRKIWKAQLGLCNQIAEDIIKNNASEELCKYADKYAVIESPYETGGGCCGEDNIRINFGEAYCHINIDENGKPTGEIWWSNEEMGIDAALTTPTGKPVVFSLPSVAHNHTSFSDFGYMSVNLFE